MIAATSMRVLALAAVLLASGCATQSNLAEQATKANLVFEDSGNRILLLNVLRAYTQRPMYFSSITKMTSPLGAGRVSVGASFGLGRDVINDILTLTPQYTPDVPSFDLQQWDQQKFYTGFTKTVPTPVFGNYLERGWPQRLILALFVREIVEETKDGTTLYWNYPERKEEFHAYTELLDRLTRDCTVRLKGAELTDFGPALSSDAVSKISELAAARKESLAIKKDPKTGLWQLKKGSASDELVLTPRHATATRVKGAACKAPAVAKFGALEQGLAKLTGEDKRYSLQLRSPEQIVYYLGELARAQLDGPYVGDGSQRGAPYIPGIRHGPANEPVPIFVVMRDEPAVPAAIAVTYDGHAYSVPASRLLAQGSLSTTVLSLLSELIGLQKEASETTPTTTIKLTP